MIRTILTKATRGRHTYWIARWRASDGKIRQRSIGKVGRQRDGGMTAAAAKDEAARLEQDLNGGKILRDRADRVLLSELVDRVRDAGNLNPRPQTLLSWRNGIDHAIACYGDLPIDKVKDPAGGKLRAHLRREGKAKSSEGKVLSVVRGLLTKSIALELIAVNPLIGTTISKAPTKESRVFTAAEVAAMVRAVDGLDMTHGTQWWQAFITTAFTTGLRRGELLGLTWDCVDLDRAEVHVRERATTEIVDVGGLEVPVVPFKPKSAAAVRTVPLDAAAVLELRRLQLASDSPCPFVSPQRLRQVHAAMRTRYGDRPDWRSLAPLSSMLFPGIVKSFHWIQKAAARSMGFRSWVSFNGKQRGTLDAGGEGVWKLGSPHDLRDSYATHAASSGSVYLHELQRWMGHSDVRITATYYTSVTPEATDRHRSAFKGVLAA